MRERLDADVRESPVGEVVRAAIAWSWGDVELARVCGRLLAERERAGRTMEEFDAWIAATAIRHDIPLATNNRQHFEDIRGLVLVAVAATPPE